MSGGSIAQFRALIAHVQQASDPEIRRALARVVSESRERLSDSSPNNAAFFDSLKVALNQLRGHANVEARVGCFYDCAQYFYTIGDTPRAIAAARDGLALATSAKKLPLARKGFTFLGNSLADVGAVGEAIECHVAAIELASQLGDADARAISIHNLGVALIYASQYQEAIHCFQVADGAIENPDLARNVHLSALANKALCYLRLDRIREGLICARQSIAEAPEPISGADVLARTIRECSLAQLALEAGDFPLAQKCLLTIRELTQRAKSQKSAVMSAIVEGLIEIHRGDASRGIELLRNAKEAAAGVDSLTQDALAALVKGYDLLGQHKQALGCLAQLMQRFSALRHETAALRMQSLLGIEQSADPMDNLRPLKHREALLRAKVAEEQLLWSQIEMLERLAVTADLREEATGEHGYRVGKLSALLAEQIGLDPDTCLAIDLAARVHDIGKMGVPDRILLTSEALKEAERHFMCKHTIFGSELLARSNIWQLRLAEEIALLHHECWDGSGYPKKLAGKRIPVHARIVALADVFDALTHGRPYAAPWTMDQAIEEIRKRRGTQFDPDLTDAFIGLVQRLRAKHADLDHYLARAGRKSPFLQARRKIKLMLEEEREHERRHTLPGNRTRH
jgi:putative two-component system response regulator